MYVYQLRIKNKINLLLNSQLKMLEEKKETERTKKEIWIKAKLDGNQKNSSSD